MARLRSFVAVEISPPLWPSISMAQTRLRERGWQDVKWVAPENLHITLKFLGDVDTHRLTRLGELLQASLADLPTFHVELGTIGAFPNLRQPRVLWVGVDQGQRQLRELAAEVQKVWYRLGNSSPDKPFHPHVTIGRVRKPRGSAGLETFSVEGNFQVRHVTLFASQLTGAGPVYTKLGEFPLADRPLGTMER
ncbi:MAG: RNA 2',3'-cyclic phosphodiesterase [Limnochordia bacterium]